MSTDHRLAINTSPQALDFDLRQDHARASSAPSMLSPEGELNDATSSVLFGDAFAESPATMSTQNVASANELGAQANPTSHGMDGGIDTSATNQAISETTLSQHTDRGDSHGT
jgi:hypothetical protein